MAYSSTNPIQLWIPHLTSGPAFWWYSSTETSTEAIATGYVTDAQARGAKVGDAIFINVSGGSNFSLGKFSAVSSTGGTIVTGTLTSTT